MTIADLYDPEALALTLDRPTTRPSQLRAGQSWRLEPVR